MTITDLPKWPIFDNEGYLDPPDSVLLEYANARADYWQARCRLAVEKLQAAYSVVGRSPIVDHPEAEQLQDDIYVTLNAIGELPPETKL